MLPGTIEYLSLAVGTITIGIALLLHIRKEAKDAHGKTRT